MTFSNRYRRGYPVALLVGLQKDQATLWKVYSHVVKPEKNITVNSERTDPKLKYNFYEMIINALRPTLREGVKSIILASPPRTNYNTDFLKHVKDHHTWLVNGLNKATFAELTGFAMTAHDITVLTRTPEFRRIINAATTEETEDILQLLEKSLNSPTNEPLVLYCLEEIEEKILDSWSLSKPKPDFLLLTDTYLSNFRQKNRLQRLMQIATNKGVKTKVIKSKTAGGKRLLQLGGIVCILKDIN